MNSFSMVLSTDILSLIVTRYVLYIASIAIFVIAIIAFGIAKIVKKPKKRTNLPGVIAFILALIPFIASISCLIMAMGDNFKVKSLVLMSTIGQFMIAAAGVPVVSIILGIIYLVRMRDEASKPKWLGACAIQLSLASIVIVVVMYYSALTVSYADMLEYGFSAGGSLLDILGF